MSRRDRNLYLVAYDIRDPKRLRRVYRLMRGYGDPAQYSVFTCVVSSTQHEQLIADLTSHIDATKDRILLVDLGPYDGNAERRIRYLGRSLPLPDPGPTIV